MKKIETRTHLATRHLFDVMVDRNRLCYEAIEQDENGNYILHKSYTINQSSGYGEESEYYLLTQEEYNQYKNRGPQGNSNKAKQPIKAKPRKGKKSKR